MRRMVLVLMVVGAACTGRPAREDAGTSAAADAGRDAGEEPLPDAGCLGFGQASTVCGFNSDGGVCTLAVTCGQAQTQQACQNRCEQSAVTTCYRESHVLCVQDAVATASCTALSACGWRLQ